MKKYIKNLQYVCFTIAASIAFTSCKENVFKAEEMKPALYFVNDSTDYSFGITPLEIESSTLEIPVHIMGSQVGSDREYKVSVFPENTDATENVHFEMPSSVVIPADSVRGMFPLQINRAPLGDESFKVTLIIQENENFVPANATTAKTVITFNNRIEQPNWLDWQGRKSWPSSKLGIWNPLVYVKFMELFAEMEEVAPATYDAIVKAYGGPLLPNFPGGWAWDYDFTLTKYVLIPLYRYFAIEHPELGVTTVPRPSSFVN